MKKTTPLRVRTRVWEWVRVRVRVSTWLKKTTPLPVVGVLACSQSLSLPQKLKMATSRPPLGQLPGTKRCGKL